MVLPIWIFLLKYHALLLSMFFISLTKLFLNLTLYYLHFSAESEINIKNDIISKCLGKQSEPTLCSPTLDQKYFKISDFYLGHSNITPSLKILQSDSSGCSIQFLCAISSTM